MKSNVALLAVAKNQLGNGGAKYRKYVGKSGNYCNMFVYWLFNANGCASLFPLPATNYYRTYCPDSIKWCKKNLAEIPPYLAMACDIIYFDWEPNGKPNHIGIVDHKIDTAKIATIEGNTSGKKNGKTVSGIVASKVRNTRYTTIYRPHFPHAFNDKRLVEDGDCQYQTIGGLQKTLKILGYYSGSIDCILGKETVRAIQRLVNCSQDGAFGPTTSGKFQQYLKNKGYYSGKVDKEFGKQSVLAMQKWINTNAYQNKPASTSTSNAQKIINKANELAWPYGTPSSKWKYNGGAPTAKCKAAMDKYGYDTKAERSDCGNLVNTVVRQSGVDKNFVAMRAVKAAFPTSDKFRIIFSGKRIPDGFLKAGDIVRYKKTKGQHALIYMGNNRVCEARHYNRFGNIYKDEKRYNKSSTKASTIQVLRAKE